jgi:FkbM family methyltransferase
VDVLKRLIAKSVLRVARGIGSDRLNLVRKIMPLRVKLALSRLVTKNLLVKDEVILSGNGLKFVPLNDGVFLHVRMEGFYEKAISAITSKLIHKGDLVVDIGANFGWYTMLLADLVGQNGKVYSFEPNHVMFDVLDRNIKLNNFQDRVNARRIGIGETHSRANFSATEGENGLGRVISVDEIERGQLQEFQDIEVEPLNVIFAGNIGQIAFIKIDVEGFEPFVILGGKKIFESDNPPVLQIEYNSDALLTRGRNIAQQFTDYINEIDGRIYAGQSGKLVMIQRLELGENADLFIFPNKGSFANRLPNKGATWLKSFQM